MGLFSKSADGIISDDAAKAMHEAFESVIAFLEQAGVKAAHSSIAGHVARVASDHEYDAARIAEAVIKGLRLSKPDENGV